MLKGILDQSIPSPTGEVKEGELYKRVHTFGKTFELRYGYYDDIDRIYPPDIIYPDFLKNPAYTENGEPFTTMMQDACNYYKGSTDRSPDTTCADCKYFNQGEEWFGICGCLQNKKNE